MEKFQNTLDEDDLLRLQNIIPSAVVIFNLDEVIFVNSAFRKILGYDLDTIKKMKLKDFISDNQMEHFLENISKLINGKISEIELELKLNCSNSTQKWTECRARTVLYNKKLYIISNVVDISHNKHIQSELSKLIVLRDSMLEVTHFIGKTENIDIIYEFILKTAVKSINNAKLGTIMLKEGDYLNVVSQTGFNKDSICKFRIPIEKSFIYRLTDGKLNKIKKIDDLRNIDDFMKIKTDNNKSDFIKSTITAPIYVKEKFFGVVNIDSTEINAFNKNDLKIMEFIKNHVEMAISNHMLYEEKIYLSKYDVLTGLYNRYYLEELFEHERKRALRYNESFNLVVFDINGLKIINDNYGHIAGDLILNHFAKNCSKMIRKSDILARYGGDEFIGIFLNSDRERLKLRLDEYLSYLENDPVYIDDNPLICTFSYGIATFKEDGSNLMKLIKNADKKMYDFKRSYKKKERENMGAIQRVKYVINNKQHAFIAINENETYISDDIGVKPIITKLRQDQEYFKDFVIGDKIIGKAAALLLVLSKVKYVYGKIMSKAAVEVLQSNSIVFEYGEVVDFIQNRTNTGMCPLEDSVKDTCSPENAFVLIEERIKELMKNK